MLNVFRKVLGVSVIVGSVLLAAAILVGNFFMNCVWFLVCAIDR